jgi:hypothetical protein
MFSRPISMGVRFAALMAAFMLSFGACAAQAAPNAVTFDGNTLQQLRSGSTGVDRFAEYGRRGDKLSETLTVRTLGDRAPFKTQMQKLVASIRKFNPQVKLNVLQRSGSDDVMISYLSDLKGTKVSLTLWRLAALEDKAVAAVYQMDFDIDDEDAKDRVTAHAAERALVTFAPADIAGLVVEKN